MTTQHPRVQLHPTTLPQREVYNMIKPSCVEFVYGMFSKSDSKQFREDSWFAPCPTYSVVRLHLFISVCALQTASWKKIDERAKAKTSVVLFGGPDHGSSGFRMRGLCTYGRVGVLDMSLELSSS